MTWKAIVAAVLIVALLAGMLFVLRQINGGSKKKEKKEEKAGKGVHAATPAEDEGAQAPRKTTSDLLPLADINDSVMVQKDGTAIAVVKVKCKNYSLLSTEEKVREAEATSVVLGSQSHKPLKVIHIQRPVDSTESIVWMRRILEARRSAVASLGSRPEEKRAAVGLMRRNEMLANLIEDESTHMKEAARTRADAYIILPVEPDVANEEAARQRARDMAEALRASGFSPSVLHAPSIVKLILDYFGSYRTENENFNPLTWTPVFTGVSQKEEDDDAA